MAKKFAWAPVLLMLCLCLQHAMAMASVTEVTRENQAGLGLKFTLVAERVSKDVVLVRMEIPRNGKLKNLRSVSLSIGPGVPVLSAPLQTTSGKEGSWIVGFQLSSDLADKGSLHLVVPEGPSAPRSYALYAVALKGYVTDRK